MLILIVNVWLDMKQDILLKDCSTRSTKCSHTKSCSNVIMSHDMARVTTSIRGCDVYRLCAPKLNLRWLDQNLNDGRFRRAFASCAYVKWMELSFSNNSRINLKNKSQINNEYLKVNNVVSEINSVSCHCST